MDKALAQKIGAAAQKALDEVAKEFGLTVEIRGGKYDPASGTYSPDVKFAEGDSLEREFKRLITQVPLVNGAKAVCVFTEDDWNAEFTSQGKTFVLTAVNPRSPKYVLGAKCLTDGKSYKFTAHRVAYALGRLGN